MLSFAAIYDVFFQIPAIFFPEQIALCLQYRSVGFHHHPVSPFSFFLFSPPCLLDPPHPSHTPHLRTTSRAFTCSVILAFVMEHK